MNDKYTVIHSEFIGELVQQANRLIEKGWKCQGGIIATTVIPGQLPSQFYQAMIREVKDKELEDGTQKKDDGGN